MAPTAQVISPTPIRVAAAYYSPAIQEKYSTQLDTNLPVPIPGTKWADIGYAFDERKFVERTQTRLRAGGLPTTVPRSWPEALHGPLVWTGSDFPDESAFVYHLTDEDKVEIGDALAYFKSTSIRAKEMDKGSFPLPRLEERLRRIKDDVYQGRGFAILRGLDVQAYPNDVDLLTVYLGLTSHVAELRGKQNHRGTMLSMTSLFIIPWPPSKT
jgi:hypothetical protein